MANIDYIRFTVDGQKLSYNQKYYTSTDTIDTLCCNFKFETDDLGHIRGGWSLPFLWTQFHDEKGNVYIKPVKDNVCAIPYDCLKQSKFKMTLFATDTEDYMVCTKRYTTNEIAFKFSGLANLNYDGGVDPDEPLPTQWQILLDRVDTVESDVDGLSQSVSVMESKVDKVSQDMSTMGDKVDSFDSRITDNAHAIDGVKTSVDELNTGLGAESTARETADTRLEELVNDRYTKTETDALLSAESTARTNVDADLQSAIQAEATARGEAIGGVNGSIGELNTKLDEESTARANADENLQSQVTGVSNDLSAETTARADGDVNLQSQIDAIVSQSDVVDIVGTHQELVNYDTTHLSENDIVKVLSDSTHDDGRTYYRWSHGAWLYVGTEGVTYTKSETDKLINDETTARTNADKNLQSLIDDEKTAREKFETETVPKWFTDESNARASGDNNLQQNINNLETTVRNNYSSSMNRISELDGRVTSNTSTLGAVTGSLGRINNLIKAIDGVGAGFHSSIYRGKYLGDTYTDEQKQAIASGTFDDLFVGDYWTINGVNWRIADFDYYYNIGDTNFTKHHVIIVPDKSLYNARMNSENVVTGAYTGSEMYTTNLDNARDMFDNAFGSQFIPTHRGFYANATSGSNPSGWAWRDMRVELMSEEQVYGHSVWGVASHNGFDVATQKTQFKLFTLDQTKINIRQYYWLTNVCASNSFAYVSSYGFADTGSATTSRGVRPFACLVGA